MTEERTAVILGKVESAYSRKLKERDLEIERLTDLNRELLGVLVEVGNGNMQRVLKVLSKYSEVA